jgi:MFS family permease
MRLSLVESACAAAAARISGGPLLTVAALWYGARERELGVLAALGALATLGSVVTAVLAPRLRSRRMYVVWAGVLGRSAWLLPAVLFIAPVPASWTLTVLLITAFLSSAVVSMAANAWQSWMTDMVPAAKRGRFFGIRNAISQAADMAVAYASGRCFDSGRAAGHVPETLAALFALTAVAAIGTAALQAWQWEPASHRQAPAATWGAWHAVAGNRAFRRLLVFGIGWAGAVGVAGPFWVAHMIRHLNMPQTAIAWYGILFGAASLVSQPLMGRLADRFGNRPLLVGCQLWMAFLPLLWLPATPSRLAWLWGDAILSGLLWPGFNLALFNLLLGTAARSNRSAGFALYSLGTGLAASVAGFTGGWLAAQAMNWQFSAGSLTLVNYHLLFLLTSVGRLSLLPVALRLADHRALAMSAILSAASDRVSTGFAGSLLTGFRTGVRRRRPVRPRDTPL